MENVIRRSGRSMLNGSRHAHARSLGGAAEQRANRSRAAWMDRSRRVPGAARRWPTHVRGALLGRAADRGRDRTGLLTRTRGGRRDVRGAAARQARGVGGRTSAGQRPGRNAPPGRSGAASCRRSVAPVPEVTGCRGDGARRRRGAPGRRLTIPGRRRTGAQSVGPGSSWRSWRPGARSVPVVPGSAAVPRLVPVELSEGSCGSRPGSEGPVPSSSGLA